MIHSDNLKRQQLIISLYPFYCTFLVKDIIFNDTPQNLAAEHRTLLSVDHVHNPITRSNAGSDSAIMRVFSASLS